MSSNSIYDMKGIHPTAIVSPNAVIGRNNYIGPYTIIGDHVIIGDNNYIGPHCVIGNPPESRDFLGESTSKVRIGDGNQIMKQVTIDGGTESITTILNNTLLLKNSHVGHDALIGNFVTLTCNVVIGGWVEIGKGCNIGLQSVVNPRTEIPPSVRIGALSLVRRNCELESGKIYGGNPLRYIKDWKQD